MVNKEISNYGSIKNEMSFRNVLVAADSGASPSKVDRAALDDIGQFNLESESQPES